METAASAKTAGENAAAARGAQVVPERRVRVAISLLSWAPQMTGAATYARELIRALGAQEEQVCLEAICNEHALARLDGYAGDSVELRRPRVYTVGGNPMTRTAILLGAAASPGRLNRRLAGQADVVHYPLTVALPRMALPTVVTLHDVSHRDLAFRGRMAAVRAWRWVTYDRPACKAAVVVTDSEHARGRIIDVLGVSPEHVVVAYLGVDHNRFVPQPGPEDGSLPERLGVREPFLYYPAGLFPHKNHLRLLEALAQLEDRDTALVLTGAEAGRLGEILERARQLGVERRVHYLGFLPDADLPALYRRAHGVVFPSLYEGFGLPPLEAMACGCPVASSREGSLGEVSGEAAAALEPKDPEQMAGAIAALIADEGLRVKLRQRGLEWASRFTWEAAAKAHVRAYRRAAGLAE